MIRYLLAIVMILPCASAAPARKQADIDAMTRRGLQIVVSLNERLGPMKIDQFALGQGGLSEDPMWDSRIAEVRALGPKIIRLFIQEYFDLLPVRGKYHFDTLDRSVDTILQAGAKPLMCICFKPHVLFPVVDQDIVEPNDYGQWEELIVQLVQHYRQRGAGIRYWEVANEPDIGESGGCPYRFKPDSYCRYYRHTVSAILRADPDARVGGPALAGWRSPILPALLDFVSKEKAPLHFVSWHIYSSDPVQIYDTIRRVKALLEKYPDLHPETFLDEWNLNLGFPPSDPRIQPCFVVEVASLMKGAGLDYSCYYHIRDYHVQFERFSPFMSAGGTAFMAGWWNRMPQFDGLFDFQNNVRPAYFAFKLLSRLTGDELRVTYPGPRTAAHLGALASRDDRYSAYQYNVLMWNFSASPAENLLTLKDIPGPLTVKPIVLDATTPSSDEIARLKPESSFELKDGQTGFNVSLEPYGVRFWSFEPRR